MRISFGLTEEEVSLNHDHLYKEVKLSLDTRSNTSGSIVYITLMNILMPIVIIQSHDIV